MPEKFPPIMEFCSATHAHGARHNSMIGGGVSWTSPATGPWDGHNRRVTEPSNPSGYTYPTQAAPPYASPTGYAPPPRSGAGVAAVVGFAVVGLAMMGVAAFFFFGMGTHVSSVSVSGGPVGVPLEGLNAEPVEPPVLTPLDTRITTPLLAAAEAEDAYAAENGSYTGAMSDLRGFSYTPVRGVTVEAVVADSGRYCLRATSGTVTWWVSSDNPTEPSTDSCA
jgi:hypothetical protein